MLVFIFNMRVVLEVAIDWLGSEFDDIALLTLFILLFVSTVIPCSISISIFEKFAKNSCIGAKTYENDIVDGVS